MATDEGIWNKQGGKWQKVWPVTHRIWWTDFSEYTVGDTVVNDWVFVDKYPSSTRIVEAGGVVSGHRLTLKSHGYTRTWALWQKPPANGAYDQESLALVYATHNPTGDPKHGGRIDSAGASLMTTADHLNGFTNQYGIAGDAAYTHRVYSLRSTNGHDYTTLADNLSDWAWKPHTYYWHRIRLRTNAAGRMISEFKIWERGTSEPDFHVGASAVTTPTSVALGATASSPTSTSWPTTPGWAGFYGACLTGLDVSCHYLAVAYDGDPAPFPAPPFTP